MVVLAHTIWGGGTAPWQARKCEPITGVWGLSPQWGPGAEPLVRGSEGQSPPEAKAFLAFGRSMEATNLSTFRNFGNTKTSDMSVTL